MQDKSSVMRILTVFLSLKVREVFTLLWRIPIIVLHEIRDGWLDMLKATGVIALVSAALLVVTFGGGVLAILMWSLWIPGVMERGMAAALEREGSVLGFVVLMGVAHSVGAMVFGLAIKTSMPWVKGNWSKATEIVQRSMEASK